ncbi:hypothetical protein FA10DRAFT_292224 [Acaromyces ingoldii]|uniref:Uncharacterized protein n=1 Tax=Acaromyces ingoldii TaxID=215250 RepID=A0A316YR77_9BASI|nr:hypothetical protein FA10DRAFT_292224 [Acaromyces ingoldii]PWN91314.1 hypothetical protein FA10DRAFT_292224 [Acaromyces ingoldii]
MAQPRSNSFRVPFIPNKVTINQKKVTIIQKKVTINQKKVTINQNKMMKEEDEIRALLGDREKSHFVGEGVQSDTEYDLLKQRARAYLNSPDEDEGKKEKMRELTEKIESRRKACLRKERLRKGAFEEDQAKKGSIAFDAAKKLKSEIQAVVTRENPSDHNAERLRELASHLRKWESRGNGYDANKKASKDKRKIRNQARRQKKNRGYGGHTAAC